MTDDTTYLQPMPQSSKRAIWVEVRDSDTGERTVDQFEAPVPASRRDRERFLNLAVPRIYPGAILKSYGGGTARFIRGMLLITAHFGAVREGAPLKELPEQPLELAEAKRGQGQLFAA